MYECIGQSHELQAISCILTTENHSIMCICSKQNWISITNKLFQNHQDILSTVADPLLNSPYYLDVRSQKSKYCMMHLTGYKTENWNAIGGKWEVQTSRH